MGSMPNEVVQIAAVGHYCIAVCFQDGASGLHDCSSLLREEGPMAIPFRDPDFFAKVRLEDGAPTWPNGYDMCPDWLRMEMEAGGELSGPLAAE
ncbi:DUF2442 domain-containing protein [Methylosinus sporium]|nr:DUF2442 domain-containing protein [Methylosinus sporium]